ncbi:unnamed protein product [Lepeophtheirus salmonis]|uniref:(salmon louse) hypothetical protein n=1 Tax=Lepeophtheirus salmonis TaxID=72036 RepID=A0A7R8HDN5_LEPSM|nr:unnamed protein product [Lepeophtheirus salmonis]CAF3026959.1 unnamed protein product [Lepeophtheirus salmonis]
MGDITVISSFIFLGKIRAEENMRKTARTEPIYYNKPRYILYKYLDKDLALARLREREKTQTETRTLQRQIISLNMSSGLERILNGNGKKKLEWFVWTDDEVKLLLKVTLEYKALKKSMNLDWEKVNNKYSEIFDNFIRRYPSNSEGSVSKKFPHKIQDITKCILATKMKTIRVKYRAYAESGRRTGHGKVIRLFHDICQDIWDDCAPVAGNGDPIHDDEQDSGPKIPFIDVEAIPEEDEEEEETEVLQEATSGTSREQRKRKESNECSITDVLQQDIALKRKYLAKMEELDQSYNEGMTELTSTIKELNRSLLDSLGVIQESLQWQRLQINNNHPSNKENSCKCSCKCRR